MLEWALNLNPGPQYSTISESELICLAHDVTKIEPICFLLNMSGTNMFRTAGEIVVSPHLFFLNQSDLIIITSILKYARDMLLIITLNSSSSVLHIERQTVNKKCELFKSMLTKYFILYDIHLNIRGPWYKKKQSTEK